MQQIVEGRPSNPFAAKESALFASNTLADRNARDGLWEARKASGVLPKLENLGAIPLGSTSADLAWRISRFSQAGALIDQKHLVFNGNIGTYQSTAGVEARWARDSYRDGATQVNSEWVMNARFAGEISWRRYYAIGCTGHQPTVCNYNGQTLSTLYNEMAALASSLPMGAVSSTDKSWCVDNNLNNNGITKCYAFHATQAQMDAALAPVQYGNSTGLEPRNWNTSHTLTYSATAAKAVLDTRSRTEDEFNTWLQQAYPYQFEMQALYLAALAMQGKHANIPDNDVGDPVAGPTGAFVTSEPDLGFPSPGVRFEFERSYSSAATAVGVLGPGWSHSYATALTISPSTGDVTFLTDGGASYSYVRQSDGSFVAERGALSVLRQTGGMYELTRPDRVVYRFDSEGALLTIRDRNGLGLEFTRNPDGRITSVTDAAERVIEFSYASGNLSSIEAPDGRRVEFGFTGGMLTSVTDVLGGSRVYEYDANGRLNKIVDQNGHVDVENTYGADGRVASQKDGLGKTRLFNWDDDAQILAVTDARGNVWRSGFAKNLLVRRIDPLGNTTKYAYDSSRNVTDIIDARSNRFTMTYDQRGNLLTRTAPAPLSYSESFTYSTANDILTTTNARAKTTEFAYDTAGNLTEIIAPGNATTEFTIDAVTGLPTAVTDARGKTLDLTYTAAGQVSEVESPLGNRTTVEYDASGHPTAMVEPRGYAPGATATDHEYVYTYDDAGRLVTAMDPLGHVNAFEYDAVGNVVFHTDANDETTSYTYDNADRLTAVTAPDLTVTAYEYDDEGNLIERTDANEHVTAYAYDPANRLVSVLTALNQRWTYEYDANGNLVKITDAIGNATPAVGDGVTSYGYDVINRLTSVDYSDSTSDEQFSYDASGNRTTMVDGAGTQTYVYDDRDRLTSVTRGSDVFSYAYDAVGNVIGRTYPSESAATYEYDDDGRLTTVARSGSETTYSYDAAANVVHTALPSGNGYEETRAYDRSGRLLVLEHEKAGVALESLEYEYDAVGNPTRLTSLGGTETYSYDERNRLTEVCFATSCPGEADPFIRYAYDDVGNRDSETRPSGTTSFSYDNGDQLLSKSGPMGTVTYDTDANGRVTRAGTDAYSYDLAGRLSSSTSAGVTTSYSYDGDGTRRAAVRGVDTTSYLWDVSFGLPQVAVERDGVSSTTSYLHGTSPISVTTAGATSYLHRNALGSVIDVTAADGATQWTSSYEPFGATRTQTQVQAGAPAIDLGFAGEYRDDDASYYLRARQYDSTIGRFRSTDPLPPLATTPYTSAYVYADNLPTALIDPSGLGAVFPDERQSGACDGVRNELRCLRDWASEEVLPGLANAGASAPTVIPQAATEVGITLRAFATLDGNCYASLLGYWGALGGLAGTTYVVRQAATAHLSKDLLGTISHPGHVMLIGAAGLSTFVAPPAAFGGYQSARCGR